MPPIAATCGACSCHVLPSGKPTFWRVGRVRFPFPHHLDDPCQITPLGGGCLSLEGAEGSKTHNPKVVRRHADFLSSIAWYWCFTCSSHDTIQCPFQDSYQTHRATHKRRFSPYLALGIFQGEREEELYILVASLRTECRTERKGQMPQI